MSTLTPTERDLLLPFHANGTLTEAERAEMDAWLAEDAAAAAEAADLAAMRADMQAEEVRSPGEFGLARLMRDIERDAAVPAPVATPVAAPVATPANSPRRPWLWQAVAALAVAGFLGQALLTGTGQSPVGGFEMAGAPAPATLAEGARLTVAFAPTATEAAIRELLVAQGLEIVAGPSALGLYTLAADDPEAALTALRAAAGLVETADRAAP